MGLVSYEGNEPYIFISYSHKDTPKVREILKAIEREKYRFWYDDTMETGVDFRDTLRMRIENCSAVLLFVSKASLTSMYCGMEIITAYKYNKKICSIHLDDTAIPPALKMILDNLHHSTSSNISDKTHFDSFIKSLPIETMKSLEVEGDVLVKCKDGSPSITAPNGVKIINEGAFKNSLKLENLDFGEEVEVLQKEACRGCTALKTLTLPKNVRKVGESCFRDCTALTELIVENEDLELGERAFENCASLKNVVLQDGMTEIYGGVFNSCKALTEIKLPKNLTILGESSFADCARLKSIDIPKNVTKIDDMVFNGCVELENIDMKDGITKIGKNAFKDCKNLKSIYIPKSVTNIGAGPFRGCCNLEEITVDSKNRWFKSLDNILFNKNKSTLICYPSKSSANEYVIPDSVTIVNDWAFCECSCLTKIVIPDSVSEIGEGAFYSCTGLTELIIPDSVTKIDDTAFRGCSSLKYVHIPDSVQEFGWGLFNGCDDVTVICSDRSPAAKYCEIKNVPHKKSI